MNQLSWLIYFAGIVDSLNGWMTAFAIVTFIMYVILTIWYIASRSDEDKQKPPTISWIMYPIFLFLLIANIAVPDRDTVLAIAASEMGEQVLKTPQAQRVGEALMNWIEDQTKPEPVETPSSDHRR